MLRFAQDPSLASTICLKWEFCSKEAIVNEEM